MKWVINLHSSLHLSTWKLINSNYFCSVLVPAKWLVARLQLQMSTCWLYAKGTSDGWNMLVVLHFQVHRVLRHAVLLVEKEKSTCLDASCDTPRSDAVQRWVLTLTLIKSLVTKLNEKSSTSQFGWAWSLLQAVTARSSQCLTHSFILSCTSTTWSPQWDRSTRSTSGGRSIWQRFKW